MLRHLHTCKPGFEETLARELALCGYREEPAAGEGFLVIPPRGAHPDSDLCFAVFSVLDVREVAAPSVNAMAGVLCDTFWECLQGERLEEPWFLQMTSVPHEAVAGRMRTVEAEFRQRLRGKMSRLAKLASTDLPADDRERRGFLVHFTDAGNALAGSRIRFWGQRRMRDNAGAPSRSYLKIEEAFAVLGRGPERGETVVDLGAAPGGWSFSAAERGAAVLAVDNGPLRGGALSHPRITHVHADAFLYRPPDERRCDWLLCDLIEDPNRVVEQILLPWLDAGWCRRFVVNLKVGTMDAIELLRRLRGIGNTGLTRRCERYLVRQLFHDREEVTCMGETE
jgi:23S rRNA (cytidine2498-2'-O)-methyltransferase